MKPIKPTKVKYFSTVAGNTLDVHEKIIKKLKKRGAKNVEDRENCDAFVVFCPIVSRFETDIISALSKVKEESHKVVVVAMHHTFDTNYTLPSPKRLEDFQNTPIVNCLFFEKDGLLKCDCNKKAIKTIKRELKKIKKQNKSGENKSVTST